MFKVTLQGAPPRLAVSHRSTAMSVRASVRRYNSLLTGPSLVSSAPCIRRKTFPPLSRRLDQSRCAHSMPSIGQYDELFKREGVSELYSVEGYDQAWTKYQAHIIDQLNIVLAGDERADLDPKSILIQTARDPATAHIFNYASMAHNNHFYMKCLSPKTTPIPKDLETSLTGSFSSIDTLRKHFIATAAGMFGPGFVWLVQTFDAPSDSTNRTSALNASRNPLTPTSHLAQADFRVLTTYMAGSPYPGAHWRQQPKDMNTENMSSQEEYMRLTAAQGAGNTFAPGQVNRRGENFSETRRFNHPDLVPVLCVNTWEHAWIGDWGVAGKRYFLEKWWDRINWETVAGHCHMAGQAPYR